MRIGVAVPQEEIASDPQALSKFVQGVEELGYAHLLVFDHVVGAARESRPAWKGPYDLSDPFHEPFVLLAWIAARTNRIGLTTGVLILPQRQTVLVAKQAAELDLLSGGRLRLGVGVGWNPVEYEALGTPFNVRGRRIEEQIRLLRRLWTEPHVTFDGAWDGIHAAGINPGPTQRPIPIWMGGSARPVIERAAAMADGWMPMVRPDAAGRRLIAEARSIATSAGRDLASMGLEGRITLRRIPPDRWLAELSAWDSLHATHATINTSGLGLEGADAHLGLLRELRDRASDSVKWERPDGRRDG